MTISDVELAAADLKADDVAALAEAASTMRRAWRSLRGWYPASHEGRIAADGSVLDLRHHEFVVSRAWRSLTCQFCWRPEIIGMVPSLGLRHCPEHGHQKPMLDDPFPLEGEELQRAKQRAWSHLRPKLGVPLKYENCALESARSTPSIAIAKQYRDVEDDELLCKCVVLYGGPGCGKTWALRAAYRDAVLEKTRHETRDQIVFFDFPQLITLLLNADERAGTLEKCYQADELFIDDLGSSYLKRDGLVQGLIEQIFIEREQQSYSMLLSTNLPPKKFRTAFGDRVYDRIAGEWGEWIDVSGPSLRRKAPRR